jgi:transposase
MSNKLIIMSKVRNIIKLYTEGVSRLSIGERLGLPRNTVKKYIRLFLATNKSLEELHQMSDSDLEQMFLGMSSRSYLEDSPRFQALEEFFPIMERALKKKGVIKEKLWEEYISANPDGYRVSQFKSHYLKWLKRRNPVMHIEHKAGEKMYVDYAGKKMQVVDPVTEEIVFVEVYVAVLGASQLTYVEASYDQKKESFIQSCDNALHYFGGAPKVIVTDNLKSAVIKSNRYEPKLNESFRDFVSYYMMAALPAGPYKPKHKALVEGAVKILYRTIYAALQDKLFISIEELNIAIWEELEVYNNKLMNARPYSRRQQFEELERCTLQALPERRYEMKRRKVVTVMKTNYVSLSEDKHYYSVPFRFIGKKVTLLYSESEVEVYYHYDRIAVHKRNRRQFAYTTVTEHLATQHKYLSDWNPDMFIEKAALVGQETKEYIEHLLSTRIHPEQAYRTCQGILSFAGRTSPERLNNACRRALLYGDYSYHTIRVILEKGLDQNIDEDINKELPNHKNIRGKNYYS